MSEDKYKNFEELQADNKEGVDYRVIFEDRGTDFVVVGIHCGGIEIGTEAVVNSIAKNDLSLYIFRGKDRSHHLTSPNFNEKRCIDLVSKSKKVISIHGAKEKTEFVMLGGLDEELVETFKKAFLNSGFQAIDPPDRLAGRQKNNICNRGSSGTGVQLEMSRGLRDSLVSDPEKMQRFTNIVRDIIV